MKKLFDPKNPDTWTWAELNDWLLGIKTLEELDVAMKLEQKTRCRPAYIRRIHARYAKLRRAVERKRMEKITRG